MRFRLGFAFLILIPLFGRAQSSIEWHGDVRVRADNDEMIGQVARRDQRFRARIGIDATVDPTLKATIRLATGKSARDSDIIAGRGETTQNATAEPGAPRRSMGLDLAYGEWAPVEALQLRLGRYPQWHERVGGSGIVLDQDLALEGATIRAHQETSSAFSWETLIGSGWIRENYDDTATFTDETDTMLYWGQAVAHGEAGDNTWMVGVGFFNYSGIQNQFFSNLAAGGSSRGNTEKTGGLVMYPFSLRQAITKISRRFGPFDAGLFGEFGKNNEAPTANSERWIGVELQDRRWTVRWASGDVGADAVPSAFIDHDLGTGQTDVQANRFEGTWRFSPNVSARLRHTMGGLGDRTVNGPFSRTQLECMAQF